MEQLETLGVIQARLYVFAVSSATVGLLLRPIARLFLRDAIRSMHDRLRLVVEQGAHVDAMEEYEAALIAAEDHRFHLHQGVDLVGIARAASRLVIHGERQGASTIEQQLVRTLTSDYRPTYRRKIREILLASSLHGRFTKKQVLAGYLSVAYFGTDLLGIESALAGIPVPTSLEKERVSYLIAHLRFPRSIKGDERHAVRRLARTRHIAKKLAAPTANLHKATAKNRNRGLPRRV